MEFEETVYEKALAEIGSDGKYQKNFDFTYNLVFIGFWSMAFMNIILALVVIPYNCQLPERPTNISEHEWKLKYIPTWTIRIARNNNPLQICSIYRSINEMGEKKLSSCSIYKDDANNSKTEECDTYEFDTTWYKSTVTLENNWVCDREINVANAYAYSRIGEAIGSVLFGWFGDLYGRRKTFIASVAVIILGRLISVISGGSFIWFTIGCIAASFPSWSATQSVTVISLEISSPERRSKAATLRAIGWTGGFILMPFLYWWLQNWKYFIIITTLPQIVFLVLSWNLIESPRWLWLEGRNRDCVKNLKLIARINGTKLESTTEREILEKSTRTKTKSYGPFALFSSWNLAWNTTLQLSSWMFVTLSYIILVMTSGEKSDGNPFLEFAWQTAAEVPGFFLGSWLCDHVGRRYAGALSFGVTAFLWILHTLRTNGTIRWLQTWWAGSIILMSNRLFVILSYYVVSLFNVELYPTCIRQSGMALANVAASGTSAIAPYIVYLGHRYNFIIPNIILTASSILGVLALLMLPETLNKKIPETLEEAKSFGRRNDRGQKLEPSSPSRSENGAAVYCAKECTE